MFFDSMKNSLAISSAAVSTEVAAAFLALSRRVNSRIACATAAFSTVIGNEIAADEPTELLGSDSAPSPVTYQWTASSGTLSSATVKEPLFTCTAAGDVSITLRVSDGDCDDTLGTTVTCSTATGGGGVPRVVVNEVETMPGFTATSMFPLLWQASGLTYPELVERLVQLAMDRSTGLR